MMEEYRQGDEFKTGILSAGAKRFKIEGKRQGKEAYADAGEGETTHGQADHDDGFGRFIILATAEEQARTLARITEAEIACEQAMIDARKREQEAQQEIDRIRDRATRTDDGRIVYLTADGSKAFDDDGNELTPEEMKGIDWNPAAPTWEQRQEATEKREQAIKDIQEIEDYQEQLQKGRERIESGEGLTTDELKGIEDDLDAMPGSVREHLGGMRKPATSAAKEYGEGQGIQAEAVSPAFTRAATLKPEEIAAIKKIPVPAAETLDIYTSGLV
jgi:hypothetical protein